MGRKKQEEEQTPEPGHNSALTEDEKRALFIAGVRELETLLDKKNDAVANVRNQRKRIVSYGFEPFQIDYAIKLRKDEDDGMIERRRKEAMVARFLNHPIGTQSDLFDDDSDRTPAVDRAYQEGQIAGAVGEKASSPYSPGSGQDQAWLRGWGVGQSALASGFKKLETVDENQDELEAA